MNDQIASAVVTYLTMRSNTAMARTLWQLLADKFKIYPHKYQLLEKFHFEQDRKPSKGEKAQLEKNLKEVLDNDEAFAGELATRLRINPI